MASLGPTYASDGNGNIAAFHGNHLITKGNDFEKVAASAEEYFNSLREHRKKKMTDDERNAATHIMTPNGEKGVILGRTASVFSDTITVRFANGQIRQFDTFVGDGLTYTKEANVPDSPLDYLQQKLDAQVVSSRVGLTERLNTLDQIRRGAAHLASQGVSDEDATRLHAMRVTADHERNEVREALDYIAESDAEAYIPPKQTYRAVEQADIGHKSGSWLDKVATDMIAESEAQDFDKLLYEGPTVFVSNLEFATLGNAGVVRDMAIDHISSRTAGFHGNEVEEYRDRFVAATEQARKRELSLRKENMTEQTRKEASVADGTPDEALFM